MNTIIKVLLIFILCKEVNAQGQYVFESDVFKILDKIDLAKKYKIKSISHYPDYKDSNRMNQCEVLELYDSTGLLINETFFPNKRYEHKKQDFYYDNNRRLTEIHHFLKDQNKPLKITNIGYNSFDQVTFITEKYINSNQRRDTIFYFYTDEGLFDYKVKRGNSGIKNHFRYNKCKEIESFELSPFYYNESIQLDSNDCITYAKLSINDQIEEDEIEYCRFKNNEKCQRIRSYSQMKLKHPDKWLIESDSLEYDNNDRLIKIYSSTSNAKKLAKSINKLKLKEIYEIEYTNTGLVLFRRKYNNKGKIKDIKYTEYKYYE